MERQEKEDKRKITRESNRKMTREESIQFYKAHAKRLYNISLRIVRDSGEAEEIMQDTILRFISSDVVPKEPAKVTAWLGRTCIRMSIDAVRKKKREKLFLDEYAGEVCEYDDGESAEVPEVSLEEVRGAIDSLPESYRLILNLVLVEGLDYEEISGLTGEREGTLRTQFSRGKAKLVEKLRRVRQ